MRLVRASHWGLLLVPPRRCTAAVAAPHSDRVAPSLLAEFLSSGAAVRATTGATMEAAMGARMGAASCPEGSDPRALPIRFCRRVVVFVSCVGTAESARKLGCVLQQRQGLSTGLASWAVCRAGLKHSEAHRTPCKFTRAEANAMRCVPEVICCRSSSEGRSGLRQACDASCPCRAHWLAKGTGQASGVVLDARGLAVDWKYGGKSCMLVYDGI